MTLGDQEVAAVAVFDLDDVAQIAEMRDLFKQNDLHFSFLPSITGVRIGQEGQEAGTLDGGVELTLIVRLRTGQASRHDLAVFLDEIAQRVDILVVDLLNVFGREAAELAALEKRILLVRTAGLALTLSTKSHLDDSSI